MKTTFLPYYLSRGILSAILCFHIFGFNIVAAILALGTFCFFVFDLHSGWFHVDKTHPFFPIRRDQFAIEVQRKSLICAVFIAILFHLLLTYFPGIISRYPYLDVNRVVIGVAVYLFAQCYQFLMPRLKSPSD